MKYVRIKGKIYAFTDLPYDSDSNGNNSYENNKLADTIEEVCDRFVIEYKDHNEQRILKTFMRVEMAFLKQQRYELHQIKAIYGAIWTDKGLIYVAKMNDKGELELL